MNNSGYSLIVLFIICFAVFFAIKHLLPKTPERQGEIGESNIASLITRSIHRGLYGYVLQNLYVPKVDGGTSEIDVLLVCTKGIFVFESKDYAGWIFGDDKHKFWTVTLYAGKDWKGSKKTDKHKFYNPIWQNNSHIRNLQRIIGDAIPMHSIIVFSNRCELKNVINSSDARIMQTRYLKHYMSDVRNIYDVVLSTDAVDSVYNLFLPLKDNYGEKKQNHLAYISEQHSNPTRCPRCGGELLIRTAKKGSNVGRRFYGCSNYPKCKYTRSIDKDSI